LRRTTSIRWWLTAAFLATAFGLFAPAVRAAPARYREGEVLIRFKDGAAPGVRKQILDKLGAKPKRHFGRIRADQIRLEKTSVMDAVRRFRNHPAVDIIEPNWIVSADLVPNDPQFQVEWPLRNTGQTGGTPGADIDAVPAWDLETGSSEVVVAIIDTGTDYNHPDLAPNIWSNPREIPANGVDDDGNGFIDDVHGYDFANFDGDPMDDNGHGTHVAGTIGAAGNNGIGITGVAWHVRLMPLKFLEATGEGDIGGAVLAVDYAVRMGAHVLNNSWGGPAETFSSLLEAAIRDAADAGVLFVAAAGNDGINIDSAPHYPASYDVWNVISVASTSADDALAVSSNYGPSGVDLAAPGVQVWSTFPQGQYAFLSGTSMAAPHVSGALALLKARYPEMPAPVLESVLLHSVERLPHLEGLLASGGRLNALRMLSGVDTIPPAPIADLAVAERRSNAMVLRWTATGDDGSVGTAADYDVRWFTAPPGSGGAGEGTRVPGTLLPGPAGTPQSFTVTGLQAATLYYFTVSVADEFGNVSAPSNTASDTTLPPPEITLTPTSFTETLLTGQSVERTLTISNPSSGTLTYAVETAAAPPSGPVAAFSKGGPDAFGHRWTDSNEPGGPVFEWVEISEIGTPLALAGDDGITGFVPIDFQFPFYDQLWSFVRVCTNGFLSLSSSATDFTNQFLPTPTGPANLIAPFWDDLSFDAGSAAYGYSDGNRFIVQWNRAVHFGGGGPYTFEAILHRDGTIVFQYLEVGPPTNSATVGIQNATRTDGLTVAFDGPYVQNRLAVRITTTPLWLSVLDPSSGVIQPGGSATARLRFDAPSLAGGDYAAAVRVASNDPDEAEILLPVAMHVDPAADIELESPTLLFGPVFVGGSGVVPAVILNRGVAPLTIASIAAEPDVFQVDPAGFGLAPGEFLGVPVTFRPTSPGPYEGTLRIVSDDPDEGTLIVPMSGLGVLPPDLTVEPRALSADLFTGQKASRTLTIGNAGSTGLTWSIRAETPGQTTLKEFSFALTSPSEPGPDGATVAQDPAAQSVPVLEAELADLTGVRILFDRSHGGDGAAQWSKLIESLRERGATVAYNRAVITTDLLVDYQILWLTDLTMPWSTAEIEAAAAWTRAGGSILFEADNATSVPELNGLLAALGTGVRYAEIPGASGTTSRVHPHEATRGVYSVYMAGNTASLVPAAGEATILVEDAAGVPNTAAGLVGAGRTLVLADELFSNFHATMGDNALFAHRAFDWLGGVGWVHFVPAQGTVAAGGTADVSVEIDAAGLEGGSYAAYAVLTSNDPEEPETSIPIDLRVTAAADLFLAPEALDFGTVFLGYSRADSIAVQNRGVEPLRIDALTASDLDFTVSESSFELAPGELRDVAVTYTPSRAGEATASIEIRSNDPDRAVVSVPLRGLGLPAPDVEAAPAAFAEALRTGERVTRELTISNRGGSDLTFTVERAIVEGGSAAGEAGPSAEAQAAPAAAPRPWSEFVSDGAGVSGGSGALAMPAVPDSLPIVVQDPAGDASASDLLLIRGGPRDGLLHVVMEFAGPVNVASFGGFLSLDTDRNRSTGSAPSFGVPTQDIGMEYELRFFALPAGIVTLHDAAGAQFATFPVSVAGNVIRFSVPLSALGGDDGRIDVTGVLGTGSGPTEWFPDAGHGTFGLLDWLSVEPASGTVPPGGQAVVQIGFDAGGLDGGGYDAQIVVASNDPDRARLAIDARLDVTGAPVLRLTPTSLDYGSVIAGTVATRGISVFNSGSQTLTVSSISCADPTFRFDSTPLILTPRSGVTLSVEFAPTEASAHDAALVFTHDAVGSPTAVPLRATAIVPPAAAVDPREVPFQLQTGTKDTETITIGNTGGTPLAFTLDAFIGAVNSGGPDRFGYRWTDSDDPDGPEFDWVEIGQTGTPIPANGRDQNVGPFPIGFEFPFYGARFETFRLCTHGWISFTSAVVQSVNQPLPSTAALENLIAPFWDALDFAGVERAAYQSDGNRLVIQYTNVRGTSGGGPYTFQAILYSTGAIVFQYRSMGSPTDGATVGIQNGSKSDGLQIAFDKTYVKDDFAVRIEPVPRWLAADPPGGIIPPGGTVPVLLSADATDLFGGDYVANVIVRSNDPHSPQIPIAVPLHVTGAPDLVLAPPEARFDTLYVGQSAARTIRFWNFGTDRLEVTGIAGTTAEVTASPTVISLAPLQSADVEVRFAAGTAGNRNTTLRIASNDPEGETALPVRAHVLLPPRAVLDPTEIFALAAPGEVRGASLQIRNEGESDLSFRVDPAQSAPWVSAEPEAGVLVLGTAAEIALAIDARELERGDHEGNLVLRTNDPAASTVHVPIRIHVDSVEASEADIDPNTLNVASQGRWIVTRVELPAPYQAGDVVLSTVRLLGLVAADEGMSTIEDLDRDGIPDLVLRFDRNATEAALPEGDDVEMTVAGDIGQTVRFVARDRVRVLRPNVTEPAVGAVLSAGTTVTVRWTDPPGSKAERADLFYTVDGGVSWAPIASGVAGNSVSWILPPASTLEALVRVYVIDATGPMGYDTSDQPFTIRPSVSGVETEMGALPTAFALRPNAPNPFNPSTRIPFDMPSSGRATIRIFGVGGRLVLERPLGALPAGRHSWRWDGRDAAGRGVASGVYIYRLEVEGERAFTASRRMILVR
jgi:subtilisin family serine protease